MTTASSYREVRETKGSRNQDSTVPSCFSLDYTYSLKRSWPPKLVNAYIAFKGCNLKCQATTVHQSIDKYKGPGLDKKLKSRRSEIGSNSQN